MINMNAHTNTNVKFFHLALKCHCIQNLQVLLVHPVKLTNIFKQHKLVSLLLKKSYMPVKL